MGCTVPEVPPEPLPWNRKERIQQHDDAIASRMKSLRRGLSDMMSHRDNRSKEIGDGIRESTLRHQKFVKGVNSKLRGKTLMLEDMYGPPGATETGSVSLPALSNPSSPKTVAAGKEVMTKEVQD